MEALGEQSDCSKECPETVVISEVEFPATGLQMLIDVHKKGMADILAGLIRM